MQVRPAQFVFWAAAAGVAAGRGRQPRDRAQPLLIAAAFVGGAGRAVRVALVQGARQRLRAFDDQLPDVLMTMAGSLKVGQSFDHSMQAIVDEGLAPASEEFGRVINETRLGRPLDEALGAMADRIDSDDFRFVLMSVTIQREIGGSLADLFQTVSDTVRSRQQFRRKVRALTAMGRASAYVLVGLPSRHGRADLDRQPRLPGTARARRRPASMMLVAVFVMMVIGGACPQENRRGQGVMPDASAARIRLSRRRARHRRPARHEAGPRPPGVAAPGRSVHR